MRSRNTTALAASIVSILFSVSTFLLAFLMIPIYLFPLIAGVAGIVAIMTVDAPSLAGRIALRLLACALPAIAIGVFIHWHRILSTSPWH